MACSSVVVAPEYVFSRTGSATTRACVSDSRTRLNGTSTSSRTFAGGASRAHARCRPKRRFETSARAAAAQARRAVRSRAADPHRPRPRRPPAARPGSGRKYSVSTPNETNSTLGPPLRATLAARPPRAGRRQRSCRRVESRFEDASGAPSELFEALREPDGGVDDGRLDAAEAAEEHERYADGVDGRKHDVRTVQHLERCENAREVPRVAATEANRPIQRARAPIARPGSNDGSRLCRTSSPARIARRVRTGCSETDLRPARGTRPGAASSRGRGRTHSAGYADWPRSRGVA